LRSSPPREVMDSLRHPDGYCTVVPCIVAGPSVAVSLRRSSATAKTARKSSTR
jgi:hypothetical protein